VGVVAQAFTPPLAMAMIAWLALVGAGMAGFVAIDSVAD